MKGVTPERMSPADLVAEVGEILAAGMQRFLANNIKSPGTPRNCEEQLDDAGAAEAPCRSTTELPT